MRRRPHAAGEVAEKGGRGAEGCKASEEEEEEEDVRLSGRCPAAVTRCKPPIKAGLNPLALFPGASTAAEGPLAVKGSSRWFKKESSAPKASLANSPDWGSLLGVGVGGVALTLTLSPSVAQQLANPQRLP